MHHAGCTQENLSVGVSTKNQINNSGFVYDAAGNLRQEPGRTYTYDVENRMTAGAGVTYFYDGDGRRVRKSNGKLYWYGMSSDALVETDNAGTSYTEFVFFGGKRIARRDNGAAVFYYFSNHLGSASVITNSAGSVVEESDYYSFGGERAVVNNDPNPYKFTGKERDTESGLDYFIARYYSSAYGRFLSPDEFTGGPVDAYSANDPLPPGPLPYADITNPQSLNKYTYTFNNPLNYTDPDGHSPKIAVIVFKAAQAVYKGQSAYTAVSEIVESTKKVFSMDGRIGTGERLVAAANVVMELSGASDLVKGARSLVRTANAVDNVTDASRTTKNFVKPGNVPLEQRDPKRLFTQKEKKVLGERASAKCVDCGTETVRVKNQAGQAPPPNQAHAGHIQPHAQGGRTVLTNGKHQCRQCNLNNRD